MKASDLPARPAVLVVTLRRLGDVLLTTPLVRTLRRGLPGAMLHMLVFKGSERILVGNPDVDAVITVPERPGAGETLALLRSLWRRYDLVFNTQTGDRPSLFSLVAGRRRVGLVPAIGGRWKRRVHQVAVPVTPGRHRVDELLGLAGAIGLELHPDLVCPAPSSADEVAPRRPYAVVHATPLYRYKRWTGAGWRDLAQGLADRGLAVVATEGRDPVERAYVDQLWSACDPPVIRERGRLDWSGLTALLKGATVYVGPDTSVTHLAAGSGCPTVALYGATSPRLIGPWPLGGLRKPWAPAGTIQRRGNVCVVQNPLPCLPCEKLGCEGRLDSYARCLDELSAAQVLKAVDVAIAARTVEAASSSGLS
jgi:heptosyltransferase III